jgi:hypothetical protein
LELELDLAAAVALRHVLDLAAAVALRLLPKELAAPA